MGKMVLKKAGAAATQSMLRDLLPFFDERFSSIAKQIETIQHDIRAVDAKVDSLGDEMLDRFERQVSVVNEVSHRITRLDGKLEGFTEAMRITTEPVRQVRKRRAS